MLFRSFLAAAMLWPAALLATPVNPVNPANAQAEASAFVYQSVFTRYQSMEDASQSPDKVWRDANDTVGRIGGHGAYLRDKMPSEELPASSKSKTETPVSGPGATPHHAH